MRGRQKIRKEENETTKDTDEEKTRREKLRGRKDDRREGGRENKGGRRYQGTLDRRRTTIP